VDHRAQDLDNPRGQLTTATDPLSQIRCQVWVVAELLEHAHVIGKSLHRVVMQVLGKPAPLVLLHGKQVGGVGPLLAQAAFFLGHVDEHDLDQSFAGADIDGASCWREHALPHGQPRNCAVQDRRHRCGDEI
jgi:hypothetical protein